MLYRKKNMPSPSIGRGMAFTMRPDFYGPAHSAFEGFVDVFLAVSELLLPEACLASTSGI
jgi:hypothetical protein